MYSWSVQLPPHTLPPPLLFLQYYAHIKQISHNNYCVVISLLLIGSSREFVRSYANFHPSVLDQIANWTKQVIIQHEYRCKTAPFTLQTNPRNSQFDVVMNSLFIHMIYIVIHLHYRRLIPTSVAIVRSRENGDDRSIMLPLISLHDKLMSACDEV